MNYQYKIVGLVIISLFVIIAIVSGVIYFDNPTNVKTVPSPLAPEAKGRTILKMN